MIDAQQVRPPRHDGEVLVVPPLDALMTLAECNRERVDGAHVVVLDGRLADIRTWTRDRLGVPVDSLLVALGHQPEWLHAGIWAKHVVAHALARRLGAARPVNLVVDTDIEKPPELRAPRRISGRWTDARLPVAPEVMPESRVEAIPRVSVAALEAMRVTVGNLTRDADAETLLDDFFQAAQAAPEGDWVDQFIAGRRAIDLTFGIDLTERRVSRLPLAPLFAWIAGAARRFAEAHNAALGAYREVHRIRGVGRPMPDLRMDAHRVELPFWVARPGGPRVRPFLIRRGNEIDFETESGEPIARGVHLPQRIDAADPLTSSLLPWRLAPRALTLTLWARLFLGDLFIHGVGGSQYDAITDDLARRWLGLDLPAYGCVSATLRLDWGFGVDGTAEPAPGGSWSRFARFHPERVLDVDGSSARLLHERAEAIRESDRLRRVDAGDRPARRACYERIRALTEAVHSAHPDVLAAAVRRDQAEADLRSTLAVALDREFFVGLHSPKRLQELCSKLIE